MSEYVVLEPDTTVPLQVYRCADRHWHFIPHKQDGSHHPPWYIMHSVRGSSLPFCLALTLKAVTSNSLTASLIEV